MNKDKNEYAETRKLNNRLKVKKILRDYFIFHKVPLDFQLLDNIDRFLNER